MTPLLLSTLAFGAGLLLGLRVQPADWLLIVCALAPALVLALRRRSALVVALMGAGMLAGGVRAATALGDCRERLPDGVTVRGAVLPETLPVEGMAFVARAATLHAADVSCADVVVRVRVRPHHHERVHGAALQGGLLVVHGRWMHHSPRNGWPRPPRYAGLLLVDSMAPAEAAVRQRGVARFRVLQQSRLRALLPQRWPLAEAMLLAQKSGLSPETRSRWVAAGLVHLLAISGMHVGLIAGGALALAGAAGLPRMQARRVALLIAAAYVLFLGAPSAALRALLQATLLLASLELQRPAEPFTALAAAALAILLFEPLALLDPGFQLSFAGMIGLIAWRAPVAERMPARLHKVVRDGVAAGIAASALTTPIAALHFGTASWIGIAASIPAVPVLGAAVALTVAALALSPLFAEAAAAAAFAADGALRLLDAIAAAAAAVPGGHGHLSLPTVLYLLLAAGALVIVHARSRAAAPAVQQRPRRIDALRVIAAAAAALVVFTWAPLLIRSGGDALEIHVIDVGQGDAIALRTPRRRWLLIDTGPRSARFDAGRDRVVPHLLRQGARRLEALVLTHPDADHIGGAEAVLEVFDVGLIVDPGFAAGKDMFIDLLSAARRSSARWVAARAGQSFSIDGIQVTTLYPLASVDGAHDANDNSVVMLLRFGAFGALFTGDAPTAVEDAVLAARPGIGTVHVLKVGHHGSRTSTGEPLLRAARPELAVISAGRGNRYGHPNQGVLHRLEAHGVRIVRTDQLGTFIVRAQRDGRTEVLAR